MVSPPLPPPPLLCLFSGLSADARLIIDWAQRECQSYRLSVEDPVTIEYIARQVAKLKQVMILKCPFSLLLSLSMKLLCHLDWRSGKFCSVWHKFIIILILVALFARLSKETVLKKKNIIEKKTQFRKNKKSSLHLSFLSRLVLNFYC